MKIVTVSYYKIATGEFRKRATSAEEHIETDMWEGESYLLEGVDVVNMYMLNGVVTPRPRFFETREPVFTIAGDGEAAVTIQNLPPGCQVTWERQMHELPDNVFRFSHTLPGRYKFYLKMPFPYFDEVFFVEVTP